MIDKRLHVRESFFETITGKELFEFICGDYIGEGIHRVVFDYRPDPTCVVKFQYMPGFQNAIEWKLWNDVQHCGGGPADWLAPCVRISENGIWLVMKKTKSLPKNFKFPEKAPRFMTDLKAQNFGLYKGRLVSHDYANNLCVNYAISKAMRKADWF